MPTKKPAKSRPVQVRFPFPIYSRVKHYADTENRKVSGAVLALVVRALALVEGQ